MTRLLNLHPEVFVSHESDVVWILYQLQQQAAFSCYPWDGPVGMNATLASCGDLLRQRPATWSVAELFQTILHRLMEHGSAIQKPFPGKGPLRWIGDKKPVQQCDPQLQAFVKSELPDARYLHIVRHPHAVVASMTLAAQTWGPVEYWRTSSFEQLLDRWAQHEEWVLSVKTDPSIDVHTVRFEDLCAAPAVQMQRILDFLELDVPGGLEDTVRAETRTHSLPEAGAIDCSAHPRVVAMMERYGYG